MSAAPLTDTDQAALKALGIDLCDGFASTTDTMTVEIAPHGTHHLKVELTLPNRADDGLRGAVELESMVGQHNHLPAEVDGGVT